MDLKQSISNQTDVALSLSKHVALTEAKDSNLVFSPSSIHVVLSLIAAGSKGPTQDQLLSFLKSKSGDELNTFSSEVVAVVFADGSPSGGPRLSFANGVWIDKSLSFKDSYKQVLDNVYKAASNEVDFQTKAVEVIQEVNSWAEKETSGLIKEVLPPGSVDSGSRLILANALYFKGAWNETFDVSKTKDHDFHLLSGSPVKQNLVFLDESRWVFDRISSSNLSLWNSLIVGYFRAGHFNEVLRQYTNLRECNIGLDGSAVTFCLKGCVELDSFEFGRGVHADSFKFGLNINPFVGSSLIGLYSEYGYMRDAYKVLEEITDRDIVVYTSMITGYVQSGDCLVHEAFDIARNMQREGLDPNRVTLVSLLQAAALLQALKEGRMIHGYAIRRGIGCSDEVFETSLMDMYIKCRDPRTAAILFGTINKRTVGSWNALIAGHLQLGQPLEALQLISLMMRESIRPDLITLANGILCCADLKILQIGKSIHGYIIQSGIQLDLVATTALVDMYSKCNNLVQARILFDGMEKRDVTSYNVMMAGYLQNEFACEAIEAFIEMVGADIKPNVGSILSLLSALSDLKDVRQGKCVHGYVIRHELDMNNEISNQFINMYAKCGCVAYARQVFSRIRYRDLLSWTSMMKGYVYHGNADEAVILFHMMKREKLEHDSVALISLLQAFSQLGCLSLATEVHSHLYRVNMERETPLINSLITIYAKCGKLDMARNLFEHMTYRCLTSWNSIIAAYGMHGHGIDALKLFERMKKVNVEPDEITFTSILTACSHSGMVEEGLRVYRSMTEEYSIVPREEHYNCMIDMFSRAGRLEEAYDLVKCVPSRQSASALVALLAACRVHGNMEMGEEIGRLILDLEPESSSAYALVSNLFAEGGKWDEVARMRAMVTNRGLKMTAGYSRIELK